MRKFLLQKKRIIFSMWTNYFYSLLTDFRVKASLPHLYQPGSSTQWLALQTQKLQMQPLVMRMDTISLTYYFYLVILCVLYSCHHFYFFWLKNIRPHKWLLLHFSFVHEQSIVHHWIFRPRNSEGEDRSVPTGNQWQGWEGSGCLPGSRGWDGSGKWWSFWEWNYRGCACSSCNSH